MITAPRIWSNALALSITPILSLIMFILELFVMLYVSHRLATPLHKNDYFPSGIVTGMINFLCPCTPVQNLGLINLFSTLLISQYMHNQKSYFYTSQMNFSYLGP